MKPILTINTFKAFSNRNYRLYFAGQGISLLGTWMQRTAVSWVVYTMTGSAFMLGVTMFAQSFPSFIFSLYGGVLSDRYDRRKILFITQTASLIQAVLLAVLILINNYTVWEILTLSVVLGIINAFDVPARQPLVHELVKEKADLPNALALNSAMVNLTRLVGPALSGMVLESFGAGICFLLNALSFVAVILSLNFMKLAPFTSNPIKKKIASDLVEGFKYMKNTPAISTIMAMLALVSLLVLPYNTLLPVFAKVIFAGNAATFGFINSFIGVGAIIGTLFLASLKPGTDLKRILLINTFLFGIGLIFFSQISSFPLAMIFAVIAGFGTMSQTTICNTIIQVNSDPAMRGRIMSFVVMALFGMMPIGSLLIGFVSQKIGAPLAICCQGIVAIIISIVFIRILQKDKWSKKESEQLEDSEEIIIQKL